ncbi:hypothetical protein J6590_061889 [Homalodisca vitripennis]|nr:hypothetical protein J6590_061889 [Homalodisca vitripennis]
MEIWYLGTRPDYNVGRSVALPPPITSNLDVTLFVRAAVIFTPIIASAQGTHIDGYDTGSGVVLAINKGRRYVPVAIPRCVTSHAQGTHIDGYGTGSGVVLAINKGRRSCLSRDSPMCHVTVLGLRAGTHIDGYGTGSGVVLAINKGRRSCPSRDPPMCHSGTPVLFQGRKQPADPLFHSHGPLIIIHLQKRIGHGSPAVLGVRLRKCIIGPGCRLRPRVIQPLLQRVRRLSSPLLQLQAGQSRVKSSRGRWTSEASGNLDRSVMMDCKANVGLSEAHTQHGLSGVLNTRHNRAA